MTLSAGSRLGAFEIIGSLGAGGMGEVYRARDLRLHRDVAIKVLPASTASDPQALARFEREALAVAALSHPNILAIFEFGHQDATAFVVTELLDGVTLRQRLTAGPLSPGKTIELGIALSQGLAAAHERGVVHRDLKPENIFLTADGRVKILDFGLARRVKPFGAHDSDHTADRPPIRVDDTGPGLVVGTLGYLSPEQARGRDVDRRGDIFSLGVVLYEMVTGRRAFTGASPADIVAAVLSTDPPPATSVRPDVPGALDRVIRRCLEKDVEDRFQSARDLGFALDAVRGSGPDHHGAMSASPQPFYPGPPESAIKRPERWAWLGGAAFAAILAGAAGWLLRGHATADLDISQPVTFDIPIGRSTGLPPVAAISPDGRTVLVANVPTAGSEGRGAFLRPLATTEVTRVSANLLTLAFWSPDGTQIAVSESDHLRTVSPDGTGAERLIATMPGDIAGGSWGPDGLIIAVRGHGLMRVPAGGGVPVKVKGPRPEAAWPQVLPGGTRILYWVPGTVAEPYGSVRLLDASGDRELVTGAASAARYAEPGYLFWGRNGQLVVQSVDPDTLAARGEPLPLARPLYQSVVAEGYPAFDVSSSGAVAFFPGFPEPMQFEWVGRRGESLGTVGPVDRYTSFDLSPDENRVLVVQRDQNTDTRTIRLIDSRTGVSTEVLSSDRGQLSDPVWAPDGVRMAVRLGGTTIVRPVLGGQESVILQEPGYPEHWSPDGRYLIVGRTGGVVGFGRQFRQSVIDLRDPGKATDIADGVLPDEGRFSPDGRQIAFHVQVNGRPEVFVEPFPVTGARQQISAAGGVQPQWCGDGRELIFLGPDGQVMSATMPSSPGGAATLPRPLFDGRLLPSAQYDQIRVSKDCSRILLQRPAGDNRSQLRVIVNWERLLRPAGAPAR